MNTTQRVSIQLSERVTRLKPSSTLAVTTKAKAMRAAGIDVIGFGAGEPDFDTPPAIVDAAIAALRAGQTRYQPVPGPENVRQAIAAKLSSDNGIDAAPSDIVVTVGGKHAGYMAMQCLLNPGGAQEVILATPAWVSYRPFVELAGGTVVEVPGSVDNAFRITPDQLEAAITPHTAAFFLNSPSNPCGSMYSPDEIRALAVVLERHPHVVIISDEIYERLVYPEIDSSAVHMSPGSISSIADRVVTLNGMSKAYAMTGWRIGYAHAPSELAKAMAKLQGQMTSNITSFVYPAMIEALEQGDKAIETMRCTFAERAVLIHRLVEAMPGVVCPRPTGAFYIFPDIGAHLGRTSPAGTHLDSATTFATALLEETNVAVVPGEDFGECAKTHVRLSFALASDQIEEGCARIGRWLERLS